MSAFKLGVLVIHGMGNQEAGFANGIIEELKARVRRLGSNDQQMCFQSVWWSPVLAQKEETLIRYLSDGNELEWMSLRRFVIHSLADAIAYQKDVTSDDQLDVYSRIHETVRESMRELRQRIRVGAAADAPEVPLVIIAHSLGCHIISNCIWDAQHPNPKSKLPKSKLPKNPFERFETVAGIITFGCNIPLFLLAHENLDPIAFPPPQLAGFFPGRTPADVSAAAKWLNFYDPDDVLGYPLRTLNPKFAATVTADHAINAGGLLRSWNPASHTGYWTDNDVTSPTARVLHELLRLLN